MLEMSHLSKCTHKHARRCTNIGRLNASSVTSHLHSGTSPDTIRGDKLDLIAGAKSIGEKTPKFPRGIRGCRAAALQALYEEDITGHPASKCLGRLPGFKRLGSNHAKLARKIVHYASNNREQLDNRIGSVALEFPVDQISPIDRNVLRLCLSELSVREDIEPAIVANEAVELARLFGSESAAVFVNGVLGALLR